MGDRNKLMLRYAAADEADKNEARRLAWGACGSDERFARAQREGRKRGWLTDSGEITESGRQRLARYPDAPGPTSPPVIIRAEALGSADSYDVAVTPIDFVPPTEPIPNSYVPITIPLSDVKPKRRRSPAKPKAKKKR